MPLTDYQAALGRLLAANRSEDSYLAGGAALLSQPHSQRFSQDLDYFHDSPTRVATAFEADRRTLDADGHSVHPDIVLPGYVRAVIRRGREATKVEWAHESSWRFMPVIRSDAFGYQLHPIDLATNKVLTVAGRDEPRDILDALQCHRDILELGPLVWAASGKDPGLSPRLIIELLKRRGSIRPEDLARLHLTVSLDVHEIKTAWLEALEGAESFVGRRPPDEIGCLYYSSEQSRFVNPDRAVPGSFVPHYGRPGGIIPRMVSE
ncbi:MAG: hypothetical protein HYT87_13980 [Nitrospirae bacterium]|nr:hypothetical protein [Nitrospirota bacterium]